MRRALAVGAAVVASLGPVGLMSPSYAAGATHATFSFDETAVGHVDGLGAGCPEFAGTMTETRHDELAGTILADGTVHGRTTATSVVHLVPDDADATSYTGGYVSRQTGTYLDGGQDDWTETTTVHGTLQGSDGSAIRFTEVVHLTTRHDGTVAVSFDRMRCAG